MKQRATMKRHSRSCQNPPRATLSARQQRSLSPCPRRKLVYGLNMFNKGIYTCKTHLHQGTVVLDNPVSLLVRAEERRLLPGRLFIWLIPEHLIQHPDGVPEEPKRLAF